MINVACRSTAFNDQDYAVHQYEPGTEFTEQFDFLDESLALGWDDQDFTETYDYEDYSTEVDEVAAMTYVHCAVEYEFYLSDEEAIEAVFDRIYDISAAAFIYDVTPGEWSNFASFEDSLEIPSPEYDEYQEVETDIKYAEEVVINDAEPLTGTAGDIIA